MAKLFVLSPPTSLTTALATCYANSDGASIIIPWTSDSPANPALGGWDRTMGGVVTTSSTGNTVTWVSGSQFIPAMVGQLITIVTNTYTVATYVSATSITLTTSPGNQTTVAYSYGASAGYSFTNFDNVINKQINFGAKSIVVVLGPISSGGANQGDDFYTPQYVFSPAWANAISSPTGQLYTAASSTYAGGGYALSTGTAPTNPSGNTWQFTLSSAVAIATGNAWNGASVTISGFTGAAVGNNGTFSIIQSAPGIFIVNNPSGTTANTGTNLSVQQAFNTAFQGFDYTCFPAAFQAPFVTAWSNAITAALNHMKTASYASKISYVRVGGGTNGEWLPYSPVALETLCTPSTINGLRTAWVAYCATMESVSLACNAGFPLDQAMNGGLLNVPYNFADVLCVEAVGNGFGIGTQGLQNADIGAFASFGTASGGTLTNNTYPDNDFIYNFTVGGAAFYECQMATISNPAYPLNSIPPFGTMGSLVPLIPFCLQFGTTDIEIYYADWQVAYDPTNQYNLLYGAAYAQTFQEARSNPSPTPDSGGQTTANSGKPIAVGDSVTVSGYLRSSTGIGLAATVSVLLAGSGEVVNVQAQDIAATTQTL